MILLTGGTCLLNVPRPDEAYSAPYCGNRLVDVGEECDCGSQKVCALFCMSWCSVLVMAVAPCGGEEQLQDYRLCVCSRNVRATPAVSIRPVN